MGISSDKWKILFLRALSLYCLISAIELLYYYTEKYVPFIRNLYPSLSTYFPSGLRFVCRLGYPVAAIGIYFLRKWAAWLLAIVWLLQLIPSSIYFLFTSGSLKEGGLFSLASFLVSMSIIYACRSTLKDGKIIKPLLIFFVCATILHTILFFVTFGEGTFSQ